MANLEIDGRIINQESPTFVVAEAGSNHDGKLSQAFELVDAAVESGADAVKFQIFKAAKLYPQNCGEIELNDKKLDLYGFLKDHEVDYSWIPKLKKYCDSKGIVFFATPFDKEAADILYENDVQVFKIASSELNHIPLIKHVAKKDKPMIMSNGLSTISDIDLALKTVRDQGNNNIAILHCLSDYPAPPEEFNLNFIQTLIKAFGVVAGVSDHTVDPVLVPTLAVCNGARIVEKHFTINKKLPGADHFYALEPDELAQMIKGIRKVERYSQKQKDAYMSKYLKIMGGYEKVIAPCEMKIYPGDKRSIFTIEDIKKGDRFNENNIDVLRAERFLQPGIHPQYYEMLVGKICPSNLKAFQGVTWDSLILK